MVISLALRDFPCRQQAACRIVEHLHKEPSQQRASALDRGIVIVITTLHHHQHHPLLLQQASLPHFGTLAHQMGAWVREPIPVQSYQMPLLIHPLPLDSHAVRPEGAPGALAPEVLGARMFLSDAPVRPTARCLAPTIGLVLSNGEKPRPRWTMTWWTMGLEVLHTWLPGSYKSQPPSAALPVLGSRLCITMCILWSGQLLVKFSNLALLVRLSTAACHHRCF